MRLRYIIYTILIVGFCSLVGYRLIKGSGAKEKGGPKGAGGPGGPAKPVRVNGVVIVPQKFDNSLSVTGTIEPNEQVQVRSEIPGLVRGIYFNEGSNVRRGQTLLTIDDSELRAQLSQALTRQNLAQQNERRARLLLEKEAISREEYDASLAEFKSLRSQTQLIRAQLAKTVIRAPFNGKIGLRSISVGEYLTPTTVVANLVNINPVKVTFSVPEKYSRSVKLNTEVTFTVAGSTQKYRAKVYAIEPLVETSTRTLQLRARADNSDGVLVPGLFATVDLPLTTIENAILVPTEAIVPVQEGKKVFVTDSGKAKEVMVQTSTRTEKDILITSGLKAGDTVLTSGLMSLKQDAPVKVNTGRKK
jgi:membrane fusion protein, multidrug efflux system